MVHQFHFHSRGCMLGHIRNNMVVFLFFCNLRLEDHERPPIMQEEELQKCLWAGTIVWRFFFALSLGIGIFHPSPGQVIRIPEDHSSIQQGINMAEDGDTVLIEEGTYYENINFAGKAITVASYFILDGDTSHIHNTIINGSRTRNPDTASVVTLWSGEDTTSILAGLTITGGKGTIVSHIHNILIQHGFDKTKYRAGGGILMENSGGKIIYNIIEGNHISAWEGVRGALGCGILAAVNRQHRAVFHGNIIRNNNIEAKHGWGGGLSLHGGGILFEHNIVENNKMDTYEHCVGAGMFFEHEKQPGTIEECIIRNNIISGNSLISRDNYAFGGGMAINFKYDSGKVKIHNNIITDNLCQGKGGAIYCFQSRIELSENLIFDNIATVVEDEICLDGRNEIIKSRNVPWNGKIWLATKEGLVRVHAGSGEIPGTLGPDGWQIKPYSNLFHIEPSTGEISIGPGINALSFSTYDLNVNTFDPPAILVDFRDFQGSETNMEPGPGKRKSARRYRLDLPYDETFLQVKLEAYKYPGKERNMYRYFLRGVDKDTIERKGYLQMYKDLKPGKYSFWANYSNVNEGWSSDPIEFDIRIHPPPYRSGLAFSYYILLVVILLSVGIRIRMIRLKREKRVLTAEVAKSTSELREKNEKILEMERLKTRFFTDVSHEIRTPLSLISGPLDKLTELEHPDPNTYQWLMMIKRNSKRLLQLVNQLLDISKLDSGFMKLVMEEYDIIKHLRVLANEYLSLAESRKIQYIIELPETEWVSWYDREKVEKIITNLLTNAFKFTPKYGTVTCRGKIISHPINDTDNAIRILVADTGPGIPMPERKKIFERFYRSEEHQYEDVGGTGIGLSLTRELIDLMHGELQVKSLVGKGTVFIMTIPLGRSHLEDSEYVLKRSDVENEELVAQAPVENAGFLEDLANETGIGLLLVEDNKDIRKLIKENLPSGYSVSEADDGFRGLELARSVMPDVIISDIMMPGMDGIELCGKIKNDERTSHIPVILLTARATEQDKMEGLETGADDYIIKPFNINELKLKIRNLLTRQERLKRKYSSMIGMDWSELSVTNLDEKFLKKVVSLISDHIDDLEFNVGILQEMMSISREHLYRKLKALTGESPSSLIRTMRLKTAASMLEKSKESITNIALKSGFHNSSSFAQSFKSYYGKSPGEYRKDHSGISSL